MTPLPGWSLLALAAFPALLAWSVDVRVLLGIPGSYSFFIGPKWPIFLAATTILAPVALLKPPRVRDGVASVAWWVAFVLFALAPWWASDTPWQTGYLGVGTRRDGALLMIGSLLLMAAGALLARRDPRALTWTAFGVLIAAFGVGAIATLQAAGIDWWELPGAAFDPPRSTVGSHAFASMWTAIGSILALHVAATSARSPTFRAAAVTIAAALAYATAAAGGRAATLALAFVIALWFAHLAWRALRQPALRPILIAVAVIVPIVAVVVARGDVATDRLERLGALFDPARAASIDTERLTFYRQAWRALAEQPLRPYGVASFAFLVWRDLEPREEQMLLQNRVHPSFASGPFRRVGFEVEYTWVDGASRRSSAVIDKVHNYLLDLAIAFGIAPTLALLTLVVAVMVRAWRSGIAFAQGVAWAALTYAVAVQAWFSALATEPVVFLLLGLAWGAAAPGVAAVGRALSGGGRAARRRVAA